MQTGYSAKFMFLAMQQAKIAYANNEVPVGAVIVRDGAVIGSGCNGVISMNSVSAHAEIIAINDAASMTKNYRLTDSNIYVTLEPCHMCAKAIVDARIKNLYFGALEPKTGAILSIDRFLDASHLNHKVNYSSGYLASDSANLLKSFFRSRRS
jgi:tRNA(adenine34) deaminase